MLALPSSRRDSLCQTPLLKGIGLELNDCRIRPAKVALNIADPVETFDDTAPVNYPTSSPPREAISRIWVAWAGLAAMISRTRRLTWALSNADIEPTAEPALRIAA